MNKEKKMNIKTTVPLLILLMFLGLLFAGCDEAKGASGTFVNTNSSTTNTSTITITSPPPTNATEGKQYTHQIIATTNSGASLTYQLVTFPQGMTLGSSTGLVNWTPAANQVGNHPVSLEVSDGSTQASLSWQILVVAAPTTGTGGTGTTTTTGTGGGGGGGIGQITSKTFTVTTSSGTLNGKYYLYVPTGYQQSTPMPLVYSQHGAGGDGYQMVSLWKSVAESQKFIVVGQDSQSTGWDFSGDIAVFEKMKQLVDSGYNIDTRRIYLHGFSAGAHWGLVWGLYKSDVFAGLALAGGGYMQFAVQTGVWPGNVPRKIPVDIHVGTSDPNLTICQDVKNTLSAAGHQIYFTQFNGGHTINPTHVLEVWNNLKGHKLP